MNPFNLFGQTAADVIAAYLRARENDRKIGTLSARALAMIRETLADFSQALGKRPVKSLSNDDLLDWLLAHDWKSPHTLTHRQGIVVTAFRWAADDMRRLIPRCPFRRTTKAFKKLQPRAAIKLREYRAIMRLTRKAQAGRIHGLHRKSAAALRFALFFLWESGARTCEMRGLRWCDVDFDDDVARLIEHKTDATGQPRVIPFTPGLARLLRWVHRRRDPLSTDHIFLNGRGRPWNCVGFARLFRSYGRLAGVRVELSPYSLRHGFCVRALDAGVGARQIADVFGHTTVRYVEWYGRSARSNAAYLRGVLDKIAKGSKSDR